LVGKAPQPSFTTVKRLKNLRDRYGITKCFATGSKSFLLSQANIPYIYWSYGSDLDTLYFYRTYPANYPKLKRFAHFLSVNLSFSREMNKTICASEKLMISAYQREGLDKLQLKKELFFLPHVLTASCDYAALENEKRHSREAVCKELEAEQFFFSSVRHVWSGRNRQLADCKGNDTVLRAFSLYRTRNKQKKCKLVLINKGYDVPASRELIQKLGLHKSVVWIEQVKRDNLAKYYKGAQLCFGQFGTPVLTNAALEPLSFATPCASYYGEEIANVPHYSEYPPVHNSKDPQSIVDFMIKLDHDAEFAGQIRFSSWDWIRRYCNENVFTKDFVGAFA
jgi:hypothetical protein